MFFLRFMLRNCGLISIYTLPMRDINELKASVGIKTAMQLCVNKSWSIFQRLSRFVPYFDKLRLFTLPCGTAKTLMSVTGEVISASPYYNTTIRSQTSSCHPVGIATNYCCWQLLTRNDLVPAPLVYPLVVCTRLNRMG
jgi:hypothetical protein